MTASLLQDPFVYPGDDPASVRQAAAEVRNGRTRLDALVDGVDGSLTAMVRSWQGTDADAVRVEMATLVTAARELAGRAGDAVAALGRHGDDLERIRRTIDGLRAEWAAAGSPRVLDDPLDGWGLLRPEPNPLDALVAGPGTPAAVGAQVWADLQARWARLVQEQEESASTCRSALAAAGGGPWQYAPDTGTIRGDLGSAIGLTELTFDDRLDSAHAALAWSALTPDEQALYVALGDDSMSALLSGVPAAATAWRGLDPMTRQALIHTRTGEIGSIDGLPVEARDQANRILLPQQRARIQAELEQLLAQGPGHQAFAEGELPAGPPESDDPIWSDRVDQARAKLAALDDIAGSVSAGDDVSGMPRHTFLLALDVTDRGRVAIAYGNPDTADQVVSLVPGTGSDLGGVLGDGERTKLMMQAAEQSGAGTVAGVVWTDWESPPTIAMAASAGYADRAADDLGSYAEGLRYSHDGDQPFRSVIAAHSYGTVVTARAASGAHTLNADALILLGSPGTDLDSVRDVQLTGVATEDVARHVFASSSDADPVGDVPHVADLNVADAMGLGGDAMGVGGDAGPGLGPTLHFGTGIELGFSDDPTSPQWGANVFRTPANHSLAYYSFGDHGRYWEPESAQLLTIGDIIADRYHGSRW